MSQGGAGNGLVFFSTTHTTSNAATPSELPGLNVKMNVKEKRKKKKSSVPAMKENMLEMKLILIFNDRFGPELRSDQRRTPVGVGGCNEML